MADEMGPSFMPQPDGGLTEHRQSDDGSGRFYKTHGGSTRKPSNDDLLEDSIIGQTANVYKRMKTNMEKA